MSGYISNSLRIPTLAVFCLICTAIYGIEMYGIVERGLTVSPNATQPCDLDPLRIEQVLLWPVLNLAIGLVGFVCFFFSF